MSLLKCIYCIVIKLISVAVSKEYMCLNFNSECHSGKYTVGTLCARGMDCILLMLLNTSIWLCTGMCNLCSLLHVDAIICKEFRHKKRL